VPLGGILFLDWSAANVLILYLVDTLLAMAVMFAGLMRQFVPPPTDEGWAARANAEVGHVGVALAICAFLAVPLGVPLIFMLMGSDVAWRELLTDPGFRMALVLQAIAAFWSCRDLYRALRTHTPDELRLKRQFALVFLRWMVVIMVSYLGIGVFLGRYAASSSSRSIRRHDHRRRARSVLARCPAARKTPIRCRNSPPPASRRSAGVTGSASCACVASMASLIAIDQRTELGRPRPMTTVTPNRLRAAVHTEHRGDDRSVRLARSESRLRPFSATVNRLLPATRW
jgi:hypothetical protein